MGKEMNKTAIRDKIAADVVEFMTDKYETDVLPIASGKFMMPVVDGDGEEGYITIQFSFPRGRRVANGYEGFNGYDAAQEYKETMDAKAAEQDAKRKDREMKEREKERKRNAKKTVKELNEKGLKKMIEEE